MTIPVHRFIFILLIFLSIPSTSTAQTVNIPDPNLRAAIAAELGKASSDPITTSDMAALTRLTRINSNIFNLIGLEHAINLTLLDLGGNSISDISLLGRLTNLTGLYLWGNLISDISSLGGLTNLKRLNLQKNSISDISSLGGLTNLTGLFLSDNSISDISSLAGLTNLTSLALDGNSISDISSLGGLTNLTRLRLNRNSISDLSTLITNTGLGSGDSVNVKRNPLSSVSIDTYIPTLQNRGVTVEFDDIVAEVVEVPDSNLRAAIAAELGKASGDPIITSDMAALTYLEAVESNIIDLTGLEHAINLTSLYLWGNSISDISSLSGLTNLRTLELWQNSISDISSFSGLTNLTSLYLWGNSISDISSLSGLTNLRNLILWGNSISDISSLSRLTNLASLSLSENSISDISSLSGLTNLASLSLSENSISDISSLSGLTNLTSLGLSFNSISDISSLSGLTNLASLSLSENSISDISSLSGLTNLTSLGLSRNSISDISSLSGLTNLTSLGLSRNSISDISSLSGLTNLRTLELSGNPISDMSSLSGLTNLTSLWLSGNPISDMSSLSGLTNLTVLLLSDNSISDISSLSGLINLTHLWLFENSISNISPLVENTGLGKGDRVYVTGNPLSHQSIHTHIPTLQSRGVRVEFDNQTHPALLKISGDNQKGAAFAPLSQPLVVEAQDANGSALAGISVTFTVTGGDGILSVTNTTTDTNGKAQSTLTLGPNLGTNTVSVSATGIEVPAIFNAIANPESPLIPADVNDDGSVNILDLVSVASEFGSENPNLAADVNGDGIINILDLILVAGMFEGAAAAPAAQPQAPETLTAVEVQGWLTDALSLEVRDPIMERGFVVLEQLLVVLTPRETELLPNYPNPFNPETWIPYRLAEDAFVVLTIYDGSGQVVRTLEVGHQIASAYESRSKAVYWDGRNGLGEQVVSGVYFYHLSTGDYSATRKMLILK